MTPLAIVKEKFAEKAKLIAEIKKLSKGDLWVDRSPNGLEHVSNAKLLHLHETFTAVKEKFGTRDKLVTAILELAKRPKDTGYKAKLDAFPVPRLYDLWKSLSHQAKNAPAAAAKPAKKSSTAVADR